MRFVRDGAVYELWIDDGGRLCTRDGDGPVEVRRTPPRSWVIAGIRDAAIERLAAGWRRVRDPRREPDFDDEPRDPRFEAALAADLDDPAALVYADWYQQQDHPRGDLIAVQCALVAQPGDEGLRARESALLRDWREHLVGRLAGEDYELVWRNGFVHTARIVGTSTFGQHEDLMWELLQHPSTRFLHVLEVAREWYHGSDLAMAHLLSADPAPPLRALHVSTPWCRPGLARLAARYPRLEVVVAASGYVFDDDIRELPFQRFAFRPVVLERARLQQLAAIRWPELVELELELESGDRYDEDDRTECSADDVVTLIHELAAPKLRQLRLTGVPFADRLAALLLRMPRPSLEVVVNDRKIAGSPTL